MAMPEFLLKMEQSLSEDRRSKRSAQQARSRFRRILASLMSLGKSSCLPWQICMYIWSEVGMAKLPTCWDTRSIVIRQYSSAAKSTDHNRERYGSGSACVFVLAIGPC